MIESKFETPANIEAEQALLGALLIRNDALFSMPDVKPETFYEPLHGRIFKAICTAVEKGMVANPITLKPIFDQDPALSDLGGGVYLVNLCASAVIIGNIEYYARLILDMAHRRAIIDTCQSTIAACMDMSLNITAGDIAADLALGADKSSETTNRYRVMTEREISEKIYDRTKNKLFAEPVKTGLRRLDTCMGGGMYPGKLYGIMGRKKMGKTMMLGTISNALQAAAVPHVFLALEMGGEEIHQRSLGAIVGCEESAFRTGFDDRPHLLKSVAEYTNKAPRGRIYVDAPGLRFGDLRALLPALIRKHKLSGFVLDSWQLVKGKKERQSEVDHLDDVAQWLAEACKKYGVWGLVSAQENQGENTRGGEGLRLACDQCYRVGKENVGSTFAWMDMMETRYTGWQGVGSKANPALCLNKNFTHFEELRGFVDDGAEEQELLGFD